MKREKPKSQNDSSKNLTTKIVNKSLSNKCPYCHNQQFKFVDGIFICRICLKVIKENTMSALSWKFFIAGVKFHKSSTVIKRLKNDDFLKLAPEPDNKYDPNAVVISFSDIVLGYVPMKISSEISAFLETSSNPICKIILVDPKAPTWEQIQVIITNGESK